MRVCLLASELPGTDPADGPGQHVLRLAERHDVTLALTESRPAGAHGAVFGDARAIAIEEAIAGDYDIAVATSWDTTIRLFEVPARRHAFWVEELAHHRLGRWQVERIAAALAYDLPVDFLAAGRTIARALGDHRPDARVLVTPTGIDPEQFATPAAEREDGPLRVLVDDRWAPEPATGPGRDAVGQTAQPVAVEYLDAGDDVHARGERYARADVLVMLDPVGAVPRSALEAGYAGVVPLVVESGAEEEVVAHLADGIVAEPEDLRGVARWLDRLAGDSELLSRLSGGARERAGGWPTWDTATDMMSDALEQLVREEPPAQLRWPVRLMADAMGAVAVFRNEYFAVAGELQRVERDRTVVAAQRLRDRWRHPRAAPLRTAARPLLDATRRLFR